MSHYDALLGTLSQDKVAKNDPDLELGSGLNVVSPLTITFNAVTGKHDLDATGVIAAAVAAASAAGGAADMSVWSTAAWDQLVSASNPADDTMRFVNQYDAPPTVSKTDTPAVFDYHVASLGITNISGGALTVRARAVLSVFSGSNAAPSAAFCVGATPPDVAIPAEFAAASVAEVAATAPDQYFQLVTERTVTLANGDDLSPVFGWGAPSGSNVPIVRSLTISYTVVPAVA